MLIALLGAVWGWAAATRVELAAAAPALPMAHWLLVVLVCLVTLICLERAADESALVIRCAPLLMMLVQCERGLPQIAGLNAVAARQT